MFELAHRGGDSAGLYCGPEGLYLGPSPLITRIGDDYRIRGVDEIAGLLAAAYGSTEAGQRLRPRLRLIRNALQEGDQCRAMILALHARLGPVAPEGMARLARTEALCKYNFNPDEPRDRLGRWTAEEDESSGPAGGNHPALPSSEPAISSYERNPTEVAQNLPLDFSPHAWGRMLQRGITPDQVMDAIKTGDRITQPNGNIRCTSAGCVVVVNPEGRIVTIY